MLEINKKLMFLIGIMTILLIAETVNANNETYFTCDHGFKFESKKNASRCIKQERLIYRPPIKCNRSKKDLSPPNKATNDLSIDKNGQKDMCVIGLKKQLQPPKCERGYTLQVRKGKDVCGKGKPEIILPATKKISR